MGQPIEGHEVSATRLSDGTVVIVLDDDGPDSVALLLDALELVAPGETPTSFSWQVTA